jgi:Tol biopolymer transport system component
MDRNDEKWSGRMRVTRRIKRLFYTYGWFLFVVVLGIGTPVSGQVFSIVEAEGKPKLRRITKAGSTGQETTESIHYVKPAWSPDGRFLAFETLTDKQRLLFVYGEEAKRACELTSMQAAASNPMLPDFGIAPTANFDLTWASSNPGLFTFVGSGSKGHFGLYSSRVDLLRNKIQAVGDNIRGGQEGTPYVAFPDYHPEKEFLVFCQGKKADIMEEPRLDLYWQDNNRRANPFTDMDNLPQLQPSFSPARGGDAIVFTGIDEGNNDIYRMDISVEMLPDFTDVSVIGGVTRLTSGPSSEGRARWSPNGEKIAFLSDKGQNKNEWALYVIDADGKSAPIHLVDRVLGEDYPEWHKDGKHIFFVKILEEKQNPIQYVNVETRQVGTLMTGTALHTHLDIDDKSGAKISFCARGKKTDSNLTWLKLYVADLEIK